MAKGRYGKEVDIYALGVILYEMLTGHVPFDGESTGEILMKHLTTPPDLTKLPPRLRGVLGHSLEKDPAQRFATIEAFAKAFDDAVLGKGPTTAGVSLTAAPAADASLDVTDYDVGTAPQKPVSAAMPAQRQSPRRVAGRSQAIPLAAADVVQEPSPLDSLGSWAIAGATVLAVMFAGTWIVTALSGGDARFPIGLLFGVGILAALSPHVRRKLRRAPIQPVATNALPAAYRVAVDVADSPHSESVRRSPSR